MNTFKQHESVAGAESAEDAQPTTESLQRQAEALLRRLSAYAEDDESLDKAELRVDLGYVQLQLDHKDAAWNTVWPVFDWFARAQDWAGAVRCCDILFQCNRPDESWIALGHGIWLAVTYPLDLELSLEMLHHLIEDTPNHADGAAVAAATANYLVDLRCPDGQMYENLSFFANQMLGKVARRHSDVQTQAEFNTWFKRLELDDPQKFLPRLSQIVEVLVHGAWRLDREALQTQLPGD